MEEHSRSQLQPRGEPAIKSQPQLSKDVAGSFFCFAHLDSEETEPWRHATTKTVWLLPFLVKPSCTFAGTSLCRFNPNSRVFKTVTHSGVHIRKFWRT